MEEDRWTTNGVCLACGRVRKEAGRVLTVRCECGADMEVTSRVLWRREYGEWRIVAVWRPGGGLIVAKGSPVTGEKSRARRLVG